MQPIPGQLSLAGQTLNYCLSRARRVKESTFDILVPRWSLYRTPIIASVENAESSVLPTLALHNYLRLTGNATYTPKGFVGSADSTGNVTVGKWHMNADANGLVNLPNVRGSRYFEDALSMRDALKAYVDSPLGKIDWQLDHATRVILCHIPRRHRGMYIRRSEDVQDGDLIIINSFIIFIFVRTPR